MQPAVCKGADAEALQLLDAVHSGQAFAAVTGVGRNCRNRIGQRDGAAEAAGTVQQRRAVLVVEQPVNRSIARVFRRNGNRLKGRHGVNLAVIPG